MQSQRVCYPSRCRASIFTHSTSPGGSSHEGNLCSSSTGTRKTRRTRTLMSHTAVRTLLDTISRDARLRSRDRDDLEEAGNRERGGGRPGKVASSVATRHYVGLIFAAASTAKASQHSSPFAILTAGTGLRFECELRRFYRSERSYQRSPRLVPPLTVSRLVVN